MPYSKQIIRKILSYCIIDLFIVWCHYVSTARLESSGFLHGTYGDHLDGQNRYVVLKDYVDQKRQGKNPVFRLSDFPWLKNVERWRDEDMQYYEDPGDMSQSH